MKPDLNNNLSSINDISKIYTNEIEIHITTSKKQCNDIWYASLKLFVHLVWKL